MATLMFYHLIISNNKGTLLVYKKIFNFSLLLLITSACSNRTMPLNLGLNTHRIGAESITSLSPCSDKPNCVVSYKFDQKHYLEPIKYTAFPEKVAYENLINILSSEKNTIILKKENGYIHANVTSGLFKFIDDVEFFFEKEGIIHFRSASRSGYYDLGANKKRMERIRFRFHQNDLK